MSTKWASPELHDRLRAMLAGDIRPVTTKDAATVVLVRDAATPRADGSGRLEVFLLRRVATMAFGAGMHVFPGGKVEPDDEVDPSVALPTAWADQLAGGDPQLLRRIVGAAVRETCEEAGVQLDPLQLKPFAHWITPEVEQRRYDTRFLIAAIPDGQQATRADGENDRGLWVSPQAGLQLTLMPPTRASLQDLAECADTAVALGRVRSFRAILPRFELDGDGFRFVVQER